MAGFKHFLYRITGLVRKQSFPVQVTIVAERYGSKKVYYDRARRVEEEGANKYVLLKDGGTFDAPAYQHLIMDKKGREKLFVYSPRPKVFVAAEFKMTKDGVPEFKVTKETDRAEVYQDLVRMARVTEDRNKLMNLLMQIAPFLMLGVVLLISIFVLQEVEKAISLADTATRSIGGLTEGIRDALNNMTYVCRGIAPPTAPPY